MSKFQVSVERWHIQMAQSYLRKMGAPGAFLLGKLDAKITAFLDAFPTAAKFQITAEAIEDKPVDNDREAAEEKVI